MNKSLFWRLKWSVAGQAALIIGIIWLIVLRIVGGDLQTSSYLTNVSFGLLASTLALAFLLRLPEGVWWCRLLGEVAVLVGAVAQGGLLIGFTALIAPKNILQQTEGPTAVGIAFVGSTYLSAWVFAMGVGLTSLVVVRIFAHLYAFWNTLRQRRLVWEITHVQVRLVVVVMITLLLLWFLSLLLNLQSLKWTPPPRL